MKKKKDLISKQYKRKIRNPPAKRKKKACQRYSYPMPSFEGSALNAHQQEPSNYYITTLEVV